MIPARTLFAIVSLGLSTRVPAQSIPTPRAGAAMTYDGARRQVLLFGGIARDEEGKPVYPQDLWAWDGTAWRGLEPAAGTPAPPGRDAAMLVYDEARGRAVLLGGRREDNAMADSATDVWEWDGSRWWRIPAPGFPYLLHAFAAYDPARRRVVLMGGGKVAPSGAFAGMSRTLYDWDGARWTMRDSLGPEGVHVGGLAVAPSGEVIMMVSDGSGRPASARVWSWSGNWTQREEAPVFRNLQPTATAPDGTFIFYQSWDERLGVPPAVHTRTPPGTWTRSGSEGGPAGRGSQAAAWDYHRGRLVVFGGRTAERVDVNETWEFDGTTWRQR